MRTIDADAYLESVKPRGISDELWKESNTYKSVASMPTIKPQLHWIPCSDPSTLPKDRTYWVTHTNGYEAWVGELYWDMTEWSDCISDVVAYMPCNIPEPYRGG